MKIHFENIENGPLTASAPAWQTEAIKDIEERFGERAKELNDLYRERILKVFSDHPNGLAGYQVAQIERQLPRWAAVKGIVDPWGHKHDATIDLLRCTVSFPEVEE